ncbi:Signal transduction histidine kinase [Butyrivibrio sp. ob235]|uniref:amino acid permease n=1 Tax=Butyrivibrio sp. ob235 TaxID=1761780 RepID=UPI0008B4823B|nr:amino acid permease [Butyrivibrio sp. ob235]SEL89858.1 Signal transduction histidine kinase [Butyrivibrio sp. ob235]
MKPTNTKKSASMLQKNLSPLNVWAISFGCAVGWGAFIMPGTTFLPIAGPLGTIISMLISAAIMLIIGVNYHFLINHSPDAGGAFTYVRTNLSYDHGFLCSWFLAIVYISIAWANATALPLIFRYFMGKKFQFGFHYQIAGYDVYLGEALLSVFAILLIGGICYAGNRIPGIVQTVCALIMIAGITVIFIAAIFHLSKNGFNIEPNYPPGKIPLLGMMNIIALSPWAFVGFESISHASEEFNFSTKKCLPIIIVSVLLSAFCYIALTLVAASAPKKPYGDWFSYINNLSRFTGVNSIPVFNSVETILGKSGIRFLILTIVGALFTGILGNMFVLSRLMMSMYRQNMLPSWFGHSDKKHISKNIIPFIVLISLPIPFLGRSVIGWIVDISSIGASIAYFYISLVAFKISKDEKNYIVTTTGTIGMLCSVFFFMYFIIPSFSSVSTLSTESYLILVIWSVLGFIFFRYICRKDDEWRFGSSTVVWIMFLFLIFFTTSVWTRQITDTATNTVVENLQDYHNHAFDQNGISQTPEEKAHLDAFLDEQMTIIKVSQMKESTIENGLIIITLIIVFSLYAGLINRQKKTAENLVKTKNKFLSHMSHEIRTPVNSIMGLDEMILRETSDDTIRKQASEIHVAGNLVVSLVNDLLDFSLIDSGNLELAETEYDFPQMVNETIKSSRRLAAAKGLAYEVRIDQDMPRRLYGDVVRLRQIYQNLLSNAVKYTNEGKISLIINFTKLDDETISMISSIVDTGIGISDNDKKRMANSFEHLGDRKSLNMQNIGLGMNIIRNLLSLMKGKLEMESESGLGSNFTFTVKQRVIDWAPIGSNALQEEILPWTKETYRPLFTSPNGRILIVDDNETNITVFKGLLKQTLLTIDTASDGYEGLKMSSKNEYDLLIIDHHMPGMDGVEMLNTLRSSADNPNRKKPCISVTANAGVTARDEYLKLGFDDYMSKPVPGKFLEEMIMKYMPPEKIIAN